VEAFLGVVNDKPIIVLSTTEADIHGKYASYQGGHMDDKVHERIGYMK
jgi:hypothetical protein